MTITFPHGAAPDFALSDDSGRMVRLSDLIGKPAVLFVYPQDGTQTCTVEAVSFSDQSGAFRRAGVRLFGVSPDSVAKHARFKAKHGLALTLLSDPERKLIEALGCWGDKVLFGRKYAGVIRSTFLIDREGRIAAEWRGVRVPGHAEAVLEAARNLREGT